MLACPPLTPDNEPMANPEFIPEWRVWDDDALFDIERRVELGKREDQAISNPRLDYFDGLHMRQPKAEIGAYVASQGFSVPLIGCQDGWEKAWDAGQAMVRSELPQDYKGYSGLLSSKVFDDIHNPLGWENIGIKGDVTREIVLDGLAYGLRNGEIDLAQFMTSTAWATAGKYMSEDWGSYGVGSPPIQLPEVSRWRYVPGDNFKVFRDPAVDGRYYLGNGEMHAWRLDGEEINQPTSTNTYYANQGREFTPAQLIEYYEAVRALPRFNQTNAPVMELQLDKQGNVHFLQYLKTLHSVDPIDEFALPSGEHVFPLSQARGSTGPDGKDYKLYITPRRLFPHMHGQAVFLEGSRMSSIGDQLMCTYAEMIVHSAYLLFKGNHFDTSPLHKPRLATALGWGKDMREAQRKFRELEDVSKGRTVYERTDPNILVYIDAHITSNGREGTIETDWQPKFEDMNSAF
jgi:hypothetical protein